MLIEKLFYSSVMKYLTVAVEKCVRQSYPIEVTSWSHIPLCWLHFNWVLLRIRTGAHTQFASGFRCQLTSTQENQFHAPWMPTINTKVYRWLYVSAAPGQINRMECTCKCQRFELPGSWNKKTACTIAKESHTQFKGGIILHYITLYVLCQRRYFV